MRRLLGRTGWASIATFFSAAVMTAGLSFTATPAQAAYELPAGEMITNSPAIPRAMPQKEAYELYDPKIGGSWGDWGRFRAIVHRVVYDLLLNQYID